MNTKKGFTLIELLVVIAIIGVLASVVLASLNSARAKAANAAVKADLANAKAEAAIFFDTNSTYAGVCAEVGINTIGDNVFAALLAGGDIPYSEDDNTRCFGDTSSWVAFSKLKGPEPVAASPFYCVDSTGRSVIFNEDDVDYLFTGGIEPGELCP